MLLDVPVALPVDDSEDVLELVEVALDVDVADGVKLAVLVGDSD